ncbi:MAG: hypothetical protein SGILL_002724 [Bacillariaceae sp.]
MLEKNQKYAIPFKDPFPLDQVPGYQDICPRVMDISTLSYNLENEVYPDMNAFFKDCFLIFENAIAYHADKDQSKWLVAPAKAMIKIVKKEQAKVEKKMAAGGGATAGKKTKKEAGTKSTKLKIKLGGAAKAKAKVKSEPMVSQGKTPPAGVDGGVGSAPKKPRITLKLGNKSSSVSSSSSSPAKSTTSAKPKGGGGGGVSRGKELPKGVAGPEAKVKAEPATKKTPAKKTTTKKTSIKVATGKQAPGKAVTGKVAAGKTATTAKKDKPPATKTKITHKTSAKSTGKGNVPHGIGASIGMTPARRAECIKVLNGVKRRHADSAGWFQKPISDKKLAQEYRGKIKHPTDFSTMQSKLDNGGYQSVAAFALDLRRISGNCLQFNVNVAKDGLRPVAMDILDTTEKLLAYYVAKPELPQPTYAPLLFCWKLCMSVLDTLYNMTNPEDGVATVYWFCWPVPFYFLGKVPDGYPPRPIDFGTITGKLLEGYYSSIDEFESDCKLVISNCLEFNGRTSEGQVYCDQAKRLGTVMQLQFDNLNRYIKSTSGQNAQKAAQAAVSTVTLTKPPVPLLLSVLKEMRELEYTDKHTKYSEPAMTHFEQPVSVMSFPDYMKIVQTPMDLQTVERRTKSGQYLTPEDFEYDMILIFQNCITYNSQRKMADHLVNIGKFGLKSFHRIFNAKMKVIDDPSSASLETGIRKEPPSGADQGPAKKAKTENSGVSRPRITLSISTISEAQRAAAQGRKSPKFSSSSTSAPKPKSNQPVPLHIAIAKVKERFPLRRNVKNLQPWETACARFFKELMKHPWISAARPKFIFHVPVPVLFPALKDAYEAKIKKPMDLTSVECTLLVGNRYASPEDFVNDVALVFSNAIIFNKDGRDIADPLSCAYYDASVHLLKYTRWLSLESLSDYVTESDHVDEPQTMGLPVSSWKLTEGNKRKARGEMESIVLKEPIEKSLEGDKFTWTEAECERLLKSLRHQSDYKHMSFFMYPTYPADYAQVIQRPMDWEKIQKTLKKRHYDTVGQVIEDLRLIFKNAFKYNAGHAGMETVSGKAFEAAKIMSAKLETAISKCMLNVSDRVERERIDHSNAEREIEAAERAEEAKIREQWKKEGKDPNAVDSSSMTVEGAQRIRSAKRIILRRRSETDFEVPFFDDEDDGQHERSYFEVMKQQKAQFERQRSELLRMRFAAGKIGQNVYSRMAQEQLALQWIADEQKKLGMSAPSGVAGDGAAAAAAADGGTTSARQGNDASALNIKPSAVLAKLDQKDRAPIKMSLVGAASTGKKQNSFANKKKSKPSVGLPAGWSSDDDDEGMDED